MIKRIDEQTIVNFGTGDINIIPGILTETEIGIVGLRNQAPREIGLKNGDKAPDNMNEFKVILQFTKIYIEISNCLWTFFLPFRQF